MQPTPKTNGYESRCQEMTLTNTHTYGDDEMCLPGYKTVNPSKNPTSQPCVPTPRSLITSDTAIADPAQACSRNQVWSIYLQGSARSVPSVFPFLPASDNMLPARSLAEFFKVGASQAGPPGFEQPSPPPPLTGGVRGGEGKTKNNNPGVRVSGLGLTRVRTQVQTWVEPGFELGLNFFS